MQEQHKVFLLFCALCLFLMLCLADLSPQSYRITETELTRLEQISQQLPKDKQNWLSLVTKLQIQVTTLKTLSTNLNSQLSQERTQTQTLRKSFEQSEKDHLNDKIELTKDRDKWKADYNKKNVDYLKTRNQRDMFGLILLVLGVCALGLLVWKFKRFIPF